MKRKIIVAKRMKEHLHEKWPELAVNTILVLLSVFAGAYLALQSTMQMNHAAEKQNYLSMLKSCENMNDHYLKNVKDIIEILNSKSNDFSEMNRLIKNIDQPFLFEEIIKNSNLYKCSSLDFKNWLPEIISFLQETNWTISKKNINSYKYNCQYLSYIKNIISNEQKFINDGLSEKQVELLNYSSRKALKDSTSNITVNPSRKEFKGSTSNITINPSRKKLRDSTLYNNRFQDIRINRSNEDLNDSLNLKR